MDVIDVAESAHCYSSSSVCIHCGKGDGYMASLGAKELATILDRSDAAQNNFDSWSADEYGEAKRK